MVRLNLYVEGVQFEVRDDRLADHIAATEREVDRLADMLDPA